MSVKLWLIRLVSVLMLTGCAAPAPPKDVYHRLSLPKIASYPLVFPGIVEVNRLESDGVLAQRPLVFQDQGPSLSQYDYDLWADTPPAMVRDLLSDLLSQSHLAHHVVTPDLRIPPDWMIRGRLLQFEHHKTTGDAVARLSLSVVSAKDGHLIWQQTYQNRHPVGGNRPADAALALNLAVGQCLTQFLADLSRQTLSQQSVR